VGPFGGDGGKKTEGSTRPEAFFLETGQRPAPAWFRREESTTTREKSIKRISPEGLQVRRRGDTDSLRELLSGASYRENPQKIKKLEET